MKKSSKQNILVMLLLIISLALFPTFLTLFNDSKSIFLMEFMFLGTVSSIGGIAISIGYFICQFIEFVANKKSNTNTED